MKKFILAGSIVFCTLAFYLISSNIQNITLNTENKLLNVSIINECGCKRILTNISTSKVSYSETTCTNSAFQRGSNQKIIGYSIYGDLNSQHS